MTDVSYEVFFDDYQFTLINGLRVIAIDPYKLPKRDLTSAQIAQTDTSKITSDFYTERNITVRVDISASTREQLQLKLDTLYANIQGVEKYLIVPQGGLFRRYTATMADVVEQADGGSYIILDVVFRCSDNFGYEQSKTLLLNNTAITTSYRIISLTDVGGSAKWQAPIITYTLNSVTNGGSPTISIGNATTGQAVTISGTRTAGDLLIINAETNSVQINGTDVAFTGAIPKFLKGGATLSYTDGLTARNATIKAEYYKRYV